PVSGEGIHFISAIDDQGHAGFAVVPIDTTAPTALAIVSQATGTIGDYSPGPATVTIRGIDPGGSGVTQVVWSMSGAQSGGPTTVNGRQRQVVVSANGTTALTFHAVDAVGHVGPDSSIDVKIDTAAPAVSCAAADGQWHASDASVHCTASDAGVGLLDP